MRGNVYIVGGLPGYKLQLPRDERKALALEQPVLALQVKLPSGQPFSFEVSFTDAGGTRRRLVFSKAFSEVKETPLHCQLPLSSIPENTWTNLALDLPSLVRSHFRGVSFKSCDVIALGASCKLRKIFTLHHSPSSTHPASSLSHADPVPRSVDFPAGVSSSSTIVLDASVNPSPPPSSNAGASSDASMQLHPAQRNRPVSDPPVSRNKFYNHHQQRAQVAFGTTLAPLSSRLSAHDTAQSSIYHCSREPQSLNALANAPSSPSASAQSRRERGVRHRSASIINRSSRHHTERSSSLSSSLRTSGALNHSHARDRYAGTASEDDEDELAALSTRALHHSMQAPRSGLEEAQNINLRRRRLALSASGAQRDCSDVSERSSLHPSSERLTGGVEASELDERALAARGGREIPDAGTSLGRNVSKANEEPFNEASEKAETARSGSPRWPGDRHNDSRLRGLLGQFSGVKADFGADDDNDSLENLQRRSNDQLPNPQHESVEAEVSDQQARGNDDTDSLGSAEPIEEPIVEQDEGISQSRGDGIICEDIERLEAAEVLQNERVEIHGNAETMRFDANDDEQHKCSNVEDDDDVHSACSDALLTPESNGNSRRPYTPPIIPASKVAESPVKERSSARQHLQDTYNASSRQNSPPERPQRGQDRRDARTEQGPRPWRERRDESDRGEELKRHEQPCGEQDEWHRRQEGLQDSKSSSGEEMRENAMRRMERRPPSAKNHTAENGSVPSPTAATRSWQEGEGEATPERVECSQKQSQGESEGGLMDLIFDPVLGLYFCPVSLQYYELTQ